MSTDTLGSRTDSDLGRILTAEVKMAVRRAMTDQAIKEVLRKEVADQVMSTVSADLEKQMEDWIAKEVGQIEARVAEKVRRDLLESWTLATTAVREEFGKVRVTPPETLKPSIQPKLVSLERPVPLAPADVEPAVSSRKMRPFFKTMSAGKVAVVVVLFLATLFLLYWIWWNVASAPRRSERNSGAQEPPVEAYPTPAPSAELSVTAQRIRTDWMEVVTAAEDQLSPGSPLRRLYMLHTPAEQFACWFSDDAQADLEKLARGSSPNDVQQQLEDVFGPCFMKKPIYRDPMLAAFAAQATVAKTFSLYRNEWDSWCGVGSEVSPPSNLIADGMTGLRTYESMNLFLKCTGHSGELAIEPSSTTSQYLYVTYLALRELQR
jgi:hypothetical protein